MNWHPLRKLKARLWKERLSTEEPPESLAVFQPLRAFHAITAPDTVIRAGDLLARSNKILEGWKPDRRHPLCSICGHPDCESCEFGIPPRPYVEKYKGGPVVGIAMCTVDDDDDEIMVKI